MFAAVRGERADGHDFAADAVANGVGSLLVEQELSGLKVPQLVVPDVRAAMGPVAQVAMLRRELVNEERWISSERFNRLLAVMQVLPGPEAHELCVHLGMRAKGRLGGVLAGLAFMLPGFLLMLALSWLYFRMDIAGTALGAAFLGVQAAVIALIVRAVHRIGEHILVDRWLWAIAIVAALASAAGVAFWITLPAAGGVYALWMLKRGRLALLVAAGAVALAAAMALWAPRAQPAADCRPA